jgi:hypothetical protein
MKTLAAQDVELRNPRGAGPLRGEQGLQALLMAAADVRLRLVPEDEPRVGDDGHVEVPVRVTVGKDELSGTARFEVRDGKVAAFEVISDLLTS